MHKYFDYIKGEISVVNDNNGMLYTARNPENFILTLHHLTHSKLASLENIKDLVAQYVKQEIHNIDEQ
jgi:hypothetical protein